MRATMNGVVLADAPEDRLLKIEGNWYFPPDTVDFSLLAESPTPYTCAWKGECQYYSIVHGDDVLSDKAWAYPHPHPNAFERVGTDFSGYVAFDRSVSVSE
ncbi:DUF427 domain-containing protein [Microbacterium aurantiacum]|uniref:DUF427 domain-containing protein n=1 Tax=Microbacterium aurantiacum TaxID=162393 RepID=UPI003F4984C2